MLLWLVNLGFAGGGVVTISDPLVSSRRHWPPKRLRTMPPRMVIPAPGQRQSNLGAWFPADASRPVLGRKPAPRQGLGRRDGPSILGAYRHQGRWRKRE